jgi:hypothetical protein
VVVPLVVGATLARRGHSKPVFQLIMAAALLDVALFVVAA